MIEALFLKKTSGWNTNRIENESVFSWSRLNIIIIEEARVRGSNEDGRDVYSHRSCLDRLNRTRWFPRLLRIRCEYSDHQIHNGWTNKRMPHVWFCLQFMVYLQKGPWESKLHQTQKTTTLYLVRTNASELADFPGVNTLFFCVCVYIYNI